MEAAIRQAEGDPDADDANRRAAERGTDLGLPATAVALGAHHSVAKLLSGSVAEVEAMAIAFPGADRHHRGLDLARRFGGRPRRPRGGRAGAPG